MTPTQAALYAARLATLPLGQERASEIDGVRVVADQAVVDAELRDEAMRWAKEQGNE
jgi:hypothetical protein